MSVYVYEKKIPVDVSNKFNITPPSFSHRSVIIEIYTSRIMLPQHLVLLSATLLVLFEDWISPRRVTPRLDPFDLSLRIVFFHVVPDRVVYLLFIDLTLCARIRVKVARRKEEKGRIFTAAQICCESMLVTSSRRGSAAPKKLLDRLQFRWWSERNYDDFIGQTYNTISLSLVKKFVSIFSFFRSSQAIETARLLH